MSLLITDELSGDGGTHGRKDCAMSVHYHTGQFPPATFDWPQLIPLIGPANAAIARYDGLLMAIPNADVLLAPLTNTRSRAFLAN